MADKTVFVQTYGCTANKADSQYMAGLLQKAGYRITSDESEAKYLLINSCAVKDATEEKIIHRLKELAKLDKKLVIAGCLTKVNPSRIKKAAPNFAGMLDTNSVHKVVDVVNEIEEGNKNVVKMSEIPADKPSLPRFSYSRVIDIIRLSEGCLSNCVFCATKLARGNLHSYRPDAIRDALIKGLKEGYREFYLSSEDSSAYGRDINTSLPELLESVTRIKGGFLVRVGMMNPLHFKKVEIDKLIEAYKSEKVFKFLHLCAQSGSNKVLRTMRRGYQVEDFISYAEKFKKKMPELTLSTDIIVGHPGEEDEDFQQTMELIKQVRPDAVNISKYSARPGTAAARMEKTDPRTVSKRSKELHDLARKIRMENNKKWVGWRGRVLVDEKGTVENTWMGRNYCYKPIVIKSPEDLLGRFVDVEIEGAKINYLIGSIIPSF